MTEETQSNDATPEPIKPSEVTPEQLAAVNQRLDDFDAAQRRARNRARSVNAVPHMDSPPNFVNRTLAPEMTAAGIDAEARADKEVTGLIERATKVAKTTQEDLAWLTEVAKHFTEMTANLLTPGQASQRLLAVSFGAEQDKFAGKLKRITDRLGELDREAAHLEKQEQQHAKLARASLQTNMAPHVASEIRQWLRSLPSDRERASALRSAVHAGDRELLHAVTEVGVPPMMLGFTDRKTFYDIVGSGERKFGGEHVARRDAAGKLRARVQQLRAHLHQSSEACMALGLLERWPSLAKMVTEARLA